MSKKIRNLFILLFSIGIASVACLLLFDLTGPLPPVSPLPNSNGYDDFVTASQKLGGGTEDYRDLNGEDLRSLVSKNSDALQLARIGFQKECLVPLDYSATSTAHLDQLSGLKRLALTFAAEGRLAEMENRPSDAAKSYLDMIHLGNDSALGGVLIDQMVDAALEALGTSRLHNLVINLDAKSCRETAATLETFDKRKQSFTVVLQQEHNWSRRAFPGLRYRLAAMLTANSRKKTERHVEQNFKEQQAKTRQLLIDLAARAYELDKGQHPVSLGDLVPDYLKNIPQDPLTGTNFTYSPAINPARKE